MPPVRKLIKTCIQASPWKNDNVTSAIPNSPFRLKVLAIKQNSKIQIHSESRCIFHLEVLGHHFLVRLVFSNHHYFTRGLSSSKRFPTIFSNVGNDFQGCFAANHGWLMCRWVGVSHVVTVQMAGKRARLHCKVVFYSIVSSVYFLLVQHLLVVPDGISHTFGHIPQQKRSLHFYSGGICYEFSLSQC